MKNKKTSLTIRISWVIKKDIELVCLLHRGFCSRSKGEKTNTGESQKRVAP